MSPLAVARSVASVACRLASRRPGATCRPLHRLPCALRPAPTPPAGSPPESPYRSGCATCLPSPLVRGPPACARSTPKVRPSSTEPGPLHHALAHPALFVVARPPPFPSRIHLPASLRSTTITALLRSYGGSDFCRPSASADRSPRFTPPGLPTVLSPTIP